jgi:hypothetical protein
MDLIGLKLRVTFSFAELIKHYAMKTYGGVDV